jgi:polysaccharide export outer membrane protein
LQISVRGQPDLSRTIVVRPDGWITFPLVDDVIAANKTPEQLARHIEKELGVFVRDPQVLVNVQNPVGPLERRIVVNGSAGQLGAIPFRQNMTLLDVVIEVGGLAPFAAGNDAVVYRRTISGVQEIPVRLGDLIGEGDPTANIEMRPGDIVMIPEGFLTGEWTAAGSVGFQTSYTDNFNLSPDGQKDPALLFTVTPGVALRGQSARVNAALSASAALQYRTLSRSEANVSPSLSATSNSELVREHLFLDANASIAQQPLSTNQSQSESGDDSGLSTVSTALVSPYLLNRLGSFANVETRLTSAVTLETNGDDNGGGSNSNSGNNDQLSNAVTNVFSIGLGSGRDFTRFLWTNRYYVGRQTRFGDSDVDGAGGVFSPEYVVKPGFSVLGDFGYEVLDDGDTTLSGPTVRGGFDWRASPTFSLRAIYGLELENETGEVNLRYDIGPRTTLVGSATRAVETGQQSLLVTTESLGVNPATGAFVDRRTGLAFTPTPQAVSVDDNLSLTTGGSLNLSHNSGVNTFSISVFVTFQEDLDNNNDQGNGGDEKNYGANASWSRQLDQKTGLTLSAGYSGGDNGNSGNRNNSNNGNRSGDKFDRYSFSIALNRTLYESLQGFIRYGFQTQTSDNRDDEFTENAVIVGLTYDFDL